MADPWSQIIEHWRRCKIAIRPGVDPDAILAFESKYGIVLPTHVREYFATVDGTGEELDDALCRFWPLAEVKPVHEVLAGTDDFHYPDRFAYPDCFVFADHCISCWDYAVKLTGNPSQPAPVFRVTATDPPGEQLAPSFRQFMAQYADDPKKII